MPKTIEVQNLSKTFKKAIKTSFLKDLIFPTFKEVNAVKNINFAIEQGESVAFLGPNGAGKTTTIKMLCGLIYPSSGDIRVLNFRPSDRQKSFLTQIGLVMGNKAGLNWDLTPKQSFALLKQIYHITDEGYKSRLADFVDLLEIDGLLDTQVRKLSLGERMKMEIIGALLHAPKVLFLDEPTIGLDIISKQKIRTFFREIQQKYNVTLLLTSHDMDDVEKVCDRVIIINKGELYYDDSLNNLVQKYSDKKFVKFTFRNKQITDLTLTSELKVIEQNGNSILLQVEKSVMPKLIAEVTENYDLEDIDIIAVPLEEIIAGLFTLKA